ncbi:MAG: ribbon-helix-helix domain-containing protein [Methylicorpusculum sp.]|uniref:CopG family ribbon-helix-helix protein n=1 Tax=Methylicorpusculum sp. TaxID=2713644 RepID=UPI00272F16B6|nr:ribbon-helix-helix domain-containing protein [Methylicorpusculum sp.]MDP2204520.1 ribbon-helix-helix domain-containing protein [Methylicorpusculum sp.]
MTTTVGVILDDETRDRLKNLGEVKQRSVHWLMREAIQDYIEKEEKRMPLGLNTSNRGLVWIMML